MKKQTSSKRRRCIIPVACVTGFIVLMNAGISLLLYQWQHIDTVSFDMTGTVNSFMAQLAEKQMSDEQVNAATVRFNTALRSVLTDWQRQHSAVILVAPAVVGGTPDITTEIQEQVAERMAQ